MGEKDFGGEREDSRKKTSYTHAVREHSDNPKRARKKKFEWFGSRVLKVGGKKNHAEKRAQLKRRRNR